MNTSAVPEEAQHYAAYVRTRLKATLFLVDGEYRILRNGALIATGSTPDEAIEAAKKAPKPQRSLRDEMEETLRNLNAEKGA